MFSLAFYLLMINDQVKLLFFATFPFFNVFAHIFAGSQAHCKVEYVLQGMSLLPLSLLNVLQGMPLSPLLSKMFCKVCLCLLALPPIFLCQ